MAEQPLDTGFENNMKKTLTSLKPYLVDNLGVQLDDLLDHLENDVLLHVDYIKVKLTPRDKVRKLLDDLVKRPARCFWTFISCLFEQRVSQGHIAVKILQKYESLGGQVRPDIKTLQTDYEQQQSQHQMQLPQQVQQQVQQQLQQQVQPQVQQQVQHGPGITESGNVLATDDGDSSETAAALPMEMDTDAPDLGGGDARPVVQTPVQAVGSGDEQNRESLSEYQKKRNDDIENVYMMDSRPRGAALIINNKNFDFFEHRVGTDEDCQMLENLFERKLHFDVSILPDLTGEDMKTELSNFVTRLSEQQREVDSCMIAILSHGWKGNVIFGTDGCVGDQNCPKEGTFITTDDLRQLFSSSICRAMEGKPKLFIIQACRGHLEDTATGQRPYYCDAPEPMPSHQTGPRQHPDKADVYIMYATVEDYVAYRNLFIKILVEVFRNYAHTDHLAELHSRVNRKMTWELKEGHIFTLSEGSSTMGKLWYFNP